MKYPPLIFTGKMGAGKSTLSGWVQDHIEAYTHVACADKLKATAVDLFGPGADKDRRILQGLGNYARSLDENVWVRPALEQAVLWGPAIFDDVRFPNEIEVLSEIEPVTIRVTAPEELRVERLKANGKWGGYDALYDESETALDDWEPQYTIVNDGKASGQDIWHLLCGIIETNMRKPLDLPVAGCAEIRG